MREFSLRGLPSLSFLVAGTNIEGMVLGISLVFFRDRYWDSETFS